MSTIAQSDPGQERTRSCLLHGTMYTLTEMMLGFGGCVSWCDLI